MLFTTRTYEHAGYLNKEEFDAAMDKLDLKLSEQDKETVWKAVDLNADGHLNYLEFCAAFQVSV